MAACHSDIAVVGRSPAFSEVMKEVDRVADTDLPVLLRGESGTGKRLVAAAIHQRSGRGDKAFVAVKCGAIHEESIAGELEAAFGGTVFLDEITETTPSFQEKLLSALQTGEMGDAGLAQLRKFNVRVIAATERPLDHEVTAGRFLNDLFQRFNAVSVPALRERPADIPALAQDIADRVYALNPPVTFSPEALALMERYSWPGNLRELENVVVRAAAMCDGPIRVKDLPARVRNYSQAAAATNGHSADAAQEEWVPLSTIEGRYVAQVLEHTRGNKQAAARLLAVDRKTLDRMIKRHHIDSEKVRRAYR
jgi:DNA-binding NtrC family response regulator